MKLRFDKLNGLVPAIVQDHTSGSVLMLAFMDRTAWETTLRTGKATYFSRSRRKSWVKGEQSGNLQIVKEIYLDCDEDTVLLKVEQVGGAACHKGYGSCFYRRLDGDVLEPVEQRVFNPEEVYNKT